MVSILKPRQPKQTKQTGVKFDAGSVKKSSGVLRSKKAQDKENGMAAVPLAKGRSDIYSKLRKQIELLECDTQEAQRKIEELEKEEEKLLQGSQAKLMELDQKFATVEESLRNQIVRLQADIHVQQLIIDEKNVDLADKNDELMLKDKEIEELKEKVKKANDRLAAAAKSLAW
jgi:chromosome segregation ATPase